MTCPANVTILEDATMPPYGEHQLDAAAAAQREQWRALCEQALDALKYHREQTRPIERTDAAIHALQSALGPCVHGRAQSKVPVSDEATLDNVQLTEWLGTNAHDDERRAPPRVTNAPADVWLVYGELDRDATHWECCRDGEVTWCEAKQYDSDVHYVRGDRYDALRGALTELRDRIKTHPAYAELTEEEEIETGGDTAEFSYLARVADHALVGPKRCR